MNTLSKETTRFEIKIHKGVQNMALGFCKYSVKWIL